MKNPVVYVDPQTIRLMDNFGKPRKSMHSVASNLPSVSVLGGNWDKGGFDFDTQPPYLAVMDVLVNCSKTWGETEYFRRRMQAINNGKFVRNCRNRKELLRRCDFVERLFERIKVGGYQRQDERNANGFEILVGIGRKGTLVFLDGRHRLSIAKALGIELVPVTVALHHQKWSDLRSLLEKPPNSKKPKIYQQINHPGLCDIPSSHGNERELIIKKSFDTKLFEGLGVLDVGAHWGHFSQMFENFGCACHAIEMSSSCVKRAKKIRAVTGCTFKITEGDAIRGGYYDGEEIILALNIFHHLIKTEKGYDALREFLRGTGANLILFESHVHKPNGQMRNAYWKPESQEFAEFVAKESGMRKPVFLGKARGSRPLYAIQSENHNYLK